MTNLIIDPEYVLMPVSDITDNLLQRLAFGDITAVSRHMVQITLYSIKSGRMPQDGTERGIYPSVGQRVRMAHSRSLTRKWYNQHLNATVWSYGDDEVE